MQISQKYRGIVTRGFGGDYDPVWLRRQFADYRDLLELREHDVRRPYGEQDATLQLLLFLLDAGHVQAAREMLRERLG